MRVARVVCHARAFLRSTGAFSSRRCRHRLYGFDVTNTTAPRLLQRTPLYAACCAAAVARASGFVLRFAHRRPRTHTPLHTHALFGVDGGAYLRGTRCYWRTLSRIRRTGYAALRTTVFWTDKLCVIASATCSGAGSGGGGENMPRHSLLLTPGRISPFSL